MALSTVRENERLRLEKDGASLGRWVDWGNHREDKGRQWGRIPVITFPLTQKCSQICKTEGGKLPLWVRYSGPHGALAGSLESSSEWPTHSPHFHINERLLSYWSDNFLNYEAGCFKSNYVVPLESLTDEDWDWVLDVCWFSYRIWKKRGCKKSQFKGENVQILRWNPQIWRGK